MHSTRYVDGVHPRYAVRVVDPVSKRRGCCTYDVFDRRFREVVYITTSQDDAGRMCDFLSCPADVAAVREFVDGAARQMALTLIAEAH